MTTEWRCVQKHVKGETKSSSEFPKKIFLFSASCCVLYNIFLTRLMLLMNKATIDFISGVVSQD
jgi:hypothetical protein